MVHRNNHSWYKSRIFAITKRCHRFLGRYKVAEKMFSDHELSMDQPRWMMKQQQQIQHQQHLAIITDGISKLAKRKIIYFDIKKIER